ncbi:Hypothetical protein, putative, partial [Bodo saltans]
MPPPLVSVKSAPRGNPIWNQMPAGGRSASGSSAQPVIVDGGSRERSDAPLPQVSNSSNNDHLFHQPQQEQQHHYRREDNSPQDASPMEQQVHYRSYQHDAPPSPSASHASSTINRRPLDGGDDIRQVPSQTLGSAPLPTTHSPKHTGVVVGPNAMPSSTSDPRAPGSGVFVKRKVKKGTSTSGDTPQPYRKSPTRAGSEGNSTPGRVRSILRNPVARHSTVTFAADVIGITFDLLESIPVLKKSDVEQSTLKDEVFASLNGPVTSREQITVNITSDDDGQGVRVEGIIDHLRNHEEQNAVIRRLADFLHSPNVFGRSLAPFLALGSAVGAADRSLNDVIQRILVREAKINDVPVKSVAPASAGIAAKRSSGAGQSTPLWDPDYNRPSVSSPPPLLVGGPNDASRGAERFEKRRRAYQASLGIVYASPLAIPTPHQGRWDRPQAEPYVVRPDPVVERSIQHQYPASAEVELGGSLRGNATETPRSQTGGGANGGLRYSYLPHGIVDSPTATPKNNSFFPPPPNPYAKNSPTSSPQMQSFAPIGTGGERLLVREPVVHQYHNGGGGGGSGSARGTPSNTY